MFLRIRCRYCPIGLTSNRHRTLMCRLPPDLGVAKFTLFLRCAGFRLPEREIERASNCFGQTMLPAKVGSVWMRLSRKTEPRRKTV